MQPSKDVADVGRGGLQERGQRRDENGRGGRGQHEETQEVGRARAAGLGSEGEVRGVGLEELLQLEARRRDGRRVLPVPIEAFSGGVHHQAPQDALPVQMGVSPAPGRNDGSILDAVEDDLVVSVIEERFLLILLLDFVLEIMKRLTGA